AAPARARAPARLGRAPAPDSGRRRARARRPLGQGLRVPRRRAADPRPRAAGRRGGPAAGRDRRRRRRSARRRRRDPSGPRGARLALARGDAERRAALARGPAPALAPRALRGAREAPLLARVTTLSERFSLPRVTRFLFLA